MIYFWGFGCPKDAQTPCWLRLWRAVQYVPGPEEYIVKSGVLGSVARGCGGTLHHGSSSRPYIIRWLAETMQTGLEQLHCISKPIITQSRPPLRTITLLISQQWINASEITGPGMLRNLPISRPFPYNNEHWNGQCSLLVGFLLRTMSSQCNYSCFCLISLPEHFLMLLASLFARATAKNLCPVIVARSYWSITSTGQ